MEIEEHSFIPPSETSTTKKVLREEDLFLDEGDDLEEGPRLLTSVSVHQPEGNYAFQVRPGKEWTCIVRIISHREESKKFPLPRGKYIIHGRELNQAFQNKGRKFRLFTCVTGEGRIFLWDVKVTEGFGDSWYKSDLRIAKKAQGQWLRWAGNEGNAHAVVSSQQDWGEPAWRGDSLLELIGIAFEDKIVDSFAHPLCKIYEVS